MENKEYTAGDYRKAIAGLLDCIHDVGFLKRIYSLIVGHQRKKAGG